MSDLDLGVDFVFNTPEAEAEAARVKSNIASVGKTAEDTAARVSKSIASISASNQAVLDKYSKIAREAEELYKSKQAAKAPPIPLPDTNNIQKVAAEILKLKDAGEENNKAQEVGADIVSNLSLETFTWGGMISLVTGLLVSYKQEIYDWIKGLIEGEDKTAVMTEAQRDLAAQMGSAGEAAGKATLEVEGMRQKFEQTREGVLTKTEALKSYNDGIGKTLGFTNDLNTAEERTIRNGDAYIELMFKKAKAAAIMGLYTEEMGKAAEALAKSDDDSVDFILSGTKGKGLKTDKGEDIFQANAKRNREEEAKPFQEKSDAFKKLWLDTNEEMAVFAKKNHLNLDPATFKEPKKDLSIDERKALLEQLEKLDAEYARKSFTRDEEELQALKDKFARIRKLVQDFNKENPTKAISLLAINNTETNAITDLEYRQRTARLKISLDEDKRLYEAYEQYKTEFGKEQADKRFKGQIDLTRTYLDKLEQERARILTVDPTQMNGAQTEELKMYDKQINDEINAQVKKHDELLKGLLSYEQTRTAMVQTYEASRAKYVLEGNITAVTVLDKLHKEALGNLDDQNTAKLSSYKGLFSGIDRLSDQAAKKVVADAKTMLDSLLLAGKISPELAKEIKEKITDTTKALDSRLPERLKLAGNELRNIASTVGKVDEGFGAWIGTLGGVVGNIGQLKSQINDIKSLKKGDILGQIGGGFGLFSTFMSIGESLGTLFGKAGKERAEQAKYASDLQVKQNEAVIKSLDRQLSLINQVYGTEKLTKYLDAVKAIGSATDDVSSQLSKKFMLSGNKEFDELLTKINNGEQAMFGVTNDEFIRKNQSKLDALKVNVNDLVELQRLIDSGKLDDTTTKLAQSLIDLKQKATDAANAIKEALTGTSFSELADGIVDVFAKGADAAKTFEEAMKKAILNSFKTKTLAAELQKFYDQFADFSQSGSQLTAAEIEKLKTQYDKIISDGQKKFDDLEKATGVKFDDSTSSGSNSLAAGIKGITADQASVLAGATNGIRLAQLEGNQIRRSMLMVGADQLAEIRAMVLSQKQIELNTKRVADTSDTYLPYLKDIAGNTKGSLDSQLRAQGFYKY